MKVAETKIIQTAVSYPNNSKLGRSKSPSESMYMFSKLSNIGDEKKLEKS